MPELPEVETVRSGLERLIQGAKIKDVEVIYPKLIKTDLEEFVEKIKLATFAKIKRRGKYLLLELDNGYTIVSHLRMEGQYSVEAENTPLRKHTELVVHLFDNRKLYYNDTRKFGTMYLAKTNNEGEVVPSLDKLGPEPTESDLKLDYIVEKFAKINKKIKATLLDQNVIAGLGNIYADEVLWQSKIHPESITKKIPKNVLEDLRKNIIQEIIVATQNHGTTVHSYSNVYGEAGEFQNQLDAYGRKDEPCKRCGQPMKKIKVVQRGTTFCEHCQIKYE